ncbi:hypothetical protein BZA77DRAFT_310539 [Pyronema omphalodes]|nr:hypothetical protein BZA77DRAFT_310539 [Pyronema omphalodes]
MGIFFLWQHATYDALARVFFFELGAVYLFGLFLIAFIQAKNCCKKIQKWASQQANGVLGIKRVAHGVYLLFL